MTKLTKKTPELEDALAGESSTGVTDQDLFPSRLQRYGIARQKALHILQYIVDNHGSTPQQHKLIDAMKHCGNYLVFRDYYTVGQIRLKAARTCRKHLLCPLCAIRRGAKLVQDYHKRYQYLMDQNPNLLPYMVTFTVKDGPDLQERMSKLKESIRVYHRRRSRQNASCEASKASAAVWSYEVKRGSGSGLWHPHVHAIWLCDSVPCQSTLRREWESIMADGSFMCDVRPIDVSDPVGGFLEVFKYATKFSEQTHEDTWHSYQMLTGKRLIGSFGDFRGIKEPDELNDELLSDELPYIDRIYQYSFGRYHPVKDVHDIIEAAKVTAMNNISIEEAFAPYVQSN